VAALAALFVNFGLAVGQQTNTGGSGGGPPPPQPPPKAKSQLEDWLDRALTNHPDIKVADAKLRTAAAELERARSLVTQQVLSLHHAIEAQKIVVAKARDELDYLARMQKKGLVPESNLSKARSDLIAAEAKLAELQGQVNHLLGRDRTTQTRQQAADALLSYRLAVQYAVDPRAYEAWVTGRQTPVRSENAERIRKALDRKVTFRCDDGTVEGVVTRLQKECPGLLIQMKGGVAKMVTARVALEELPVGAVLQWLEDSLQGCRLVVREYGILLATEDEIPHRAVPLVEFWKGRADMDGGKKPSGSSQR
jgi:hypothetical protein